jgi:sucrose-6-phosphate hydrolase SacC (GH32 family)
MLALCLLMQQLLPLVRCSHQPAAAGPYQGHCSSFWPGDPKDPGCWAWDWQFQFHPVTTSSPTVGDSSGGLFVNGSWHTFYSCAGGWCHLSTRDLVHYESHGIIVAKPSPSYPGHLGLGTGSVVAAPDGSGDILGFVNNQGGHMRSEDGMQTWTAYKTTTGPNPGGRDQARPLQSADGTWYQMAGCGGSDGAAVCRFRASDLSLSNWTYDGKVYVSNSTWTGVGGNWVNFYEVPDFYPLTSSKGVTKHVLVTDPWASGGPGGAGYHVHNVEWRTGVWSADGKHFAVEKTGCLDYGWWYAARSITNLSNSGRRLMSGNIGTDVTQGSHSVEGHVPGAGGIRMFTSLPREVSLADDGSTVHVKPPLELEGLRAGPAKTTTLAAFACGKQTLLDSNITTGEFQVLLDVSQMAASPTGPVVGAAASVPVAEEEEGTAEVGLFLLGSPGTYRIGINELHESVAD